MTGESLSEMRMLLEHMPIADRDKFTREGSMAFSVVKLKGYYRVSLGEILPDRMGKERYAPCSTRPYKSIPEGMTIEDIVADEVVSLGESMNFFTIYVEGKVYKAAATPIKLPGR